MWAGRIPLGVCRFNKRGDVNDIVMASIFGVFVIFFSCLRLTVTFVITTYKGYERPLRFVLADALSDANRRD